jgi:hypothetical protein
MSFFHSDDDDMPSPAFLLLTAPISLPILAVYGAAVGVKALIVHGPIAAVKHLTAAAKKAKTAGKK